MSDATPRGTPLSVVFAVVFPVFLIIVYYQTSWSMVHTWWRSDTFAHGFLILPIVIWLVAGKRSELAQFTPRPQLAALPFCFLAGLAWFLGNLVDVIVVQQFALVSFIVLAIWAILGNKLTSILAFPLFFLFFAVPIGEFLLPPLMEFTATFSVKALRLSGVPVYREGMFLTLPTGYWSVVEGCSGLRYLIASVTLGCLYAYLTYRSVYRRAIFVAISFLVPILANGIRAYGIIMIGHLSDMQLATGTDHLLYGWVFFGIVMFVLFAIGQLWHETDKDAKQPEAVVAQHEADSAAGASLTLVAVSLLLIALLWPVTTFWLEQNSANPANAERSLGTPAGSVGWHHSGPESYCWKPEVSAPTGEVLQVFSKNGEQVCLYMAQFLSQEQGAELVHGQNIFTGPDDRLWRAQERGNVAVETGGGTRTVSLLRILGPEKGIEVWYWYRLGDEVTSNRFMAKWLEIKSRLLFSRTDAALIAISTPWQQEHESVRPTLEAFVNDMLPQIDTALDQVVAQEPR